MLKLIAIFVICTSCALPLEASIGEPEPAKELTAEQIKEAKAGKSAYDSLINPSFYVSKTQNAKDLEAVCAFIIEQILARIENVLLEVMKKDSNGFKNFKVHSRELSESLDSLVQSPMPLKLYKAAEWALGNFDKERGTFYKAKEYTGNLIKMYKNKGQKISNKLIKERLDMELNDLDTRYKPLATSLKKIKKTSPLLDSLMPLDYLYINALEQK